MLLLLEVGFLDIFLVKFKIGFLLKLILVDVFLLGVLFLLELLVLLLLVVLLVIILLVGFIVIIVVLLMNGLRFL